MSDEVLEHKLRLGNYELLFELATGGMATVYVARHVGAAGFERLVVVKRVHRHLLGNREFTEMFIDEARVASYVRHPNVVTVIDVVEAEGEIFLVMEYVESAALSTLWKGARQQQRLLPPGVVVRVITDVLSGLHAAHEAIDMRGNRLDIVHRDVSPQNVIVGLDGCSRLIDFGVAKAAYRITETRSGSVKGKYGYMSPEQTRAAPLDRRADLFAVGTVLYEALTGKRLFAGENEFDTMRKIQEMPIVDPSAIVPGLPRTLDEVLQKALARPMDERFQTATEFLEALEKAYFPAPIRDVAACVHDLCGEQLIKRRTMLQALQAAERSSESVRVTGLDLLATVATSPSARRRNADTRSTSTSTPSGVTDPNLANDRTESKIAAIRDASPRTSWVADGRKRRYGAVTVVAVATLGLAIFGLRRVAHNPEEGTDSPIVQAAHGNENEAANPAIPATAAALAANQVQAQPSQTSQPSHPSTLQPISADVVAVDAVELTLSADAPIASLQARGLRSMEIHGKQAKAVVAAFSTPLLIEATLANGRSARGIVDPAGGRQIHLATFSAPARPRTPSTKPSPAVAPPPPAPTKPELHGNPYETQ